MSNIQLKIDGLIENSPLTILDIGARGGVHPRWTRFLKNYTAVLFEPEPKEYEQLKKRLPSNYILFNTALSDSRRELTLYICKSGGATSVYPPNMEILNNFPKSDRFNVVQKETISATALDDALTGSELRHIDFIKIDTQGHELAILKGTEKHLPQVLGLEIEVEFMELYKGQCMFSEVDEFVRSKGFELIDLRRSYWRRKDDSPLSMSGKGQLAFGDALYFRAPEYIISNTRVSPDLILKMSVIYSVYGYFGLAEKVLRLGLEAGVLTSVLYKEAIVCLKKFKRIQNIFSTLPIKMAIDFKEKLSRFVHGNSWYSGDLYPGNLFFWS